MAIAYSLTIKREAMPPTEFNRQSIMGSSQLFPSCGTVEKGELGCFYTGGKALQQGL